MDQVKVGSFLRELRKEKKLTQEELAEYLNVSNRTDTTVKMVEYSQHEVKVGKKKVECCLLIVFGIFLMVSALVVFPSESSWGGFYSVIGGLLFCIGIFIATNIIWDNKKISMVGTLGIEIVEAKKIITMLI